MELQTLRLFLRPMSEADFPDFRHYLLDGELCRMYGLPVCKEEDTIRAIFDSFLQNGKTAAIILRETGRMIGHVLVVPSELPDAFRRTVPRGDGVTLAFALSPEHQRRGLMTEALTAVIRWVFDVRHAAYIHCCRFDFNEPSARLQRRLGFGDLGSRTLTYRDGDRTLVDSVLRREDAQASIRIRRMTAADIPVIVAEEAAQGWHPSCDKYEMRLRDMEAGRSTALVAEYNGQVAGYINLYRRPLDGAFADRDWPEIVDFGVLAKYRRRGIGTALMDAAEALAAQVSDTVCLGVGVSCGYGSAQRMYVRRGYIPDGSGVWYGSTVCPEYAPCCNDDDLVLYLSKQL